MKHLGLFLILLLLAAVSLQSCGGSADEKSEAVKQTPTLQTVDVDKELKQVKEKLLSLESENKELHASNKMLSEKLKELQEAAEAEIHKESTKKSSGSSSGAVSDQTRIALMGAKAVAEFRADQAERRVKSLTANLSQKEEDLKNALENVENVSHENDQLRKKLETLTAAVASKESEYEQTVKKLESTVAERASIIAKQEEELKQKEDILNTLKTALSDAGQLKSVAEANLDQLKKNLTECQNMNNELKTSMDKQQKETAMLSGELENLKQNYSSCLNQFTSLKAQSDTYLKQIKHLESYIAKHKSVTTTQKGKEKTLPIIEKLLDSSTPESSQKGK